MTEVAASISSWSALFTVSTTVASNWRCADDNLLRQLLQPEPDQLRGLGLLARAARRSGDRCRGLRLAIAEIDQGRDRIRDRLWRARLVDRTRQADHGRIRIGKMRRLVLQLGDDAL